VGVLKRVKAGEIADVVIIPQQGIKTLLKDGNTAARGAGY
jgi:hypothetical protein